MKHVALSLICTCFLMEAANAQTLPKDSLFLMFNWNGKQYKRENRSLRQIEGDIIVDYFTFTYPIMGGHELELRTLDKNTYQPKIIDLKDLNKYQVYTIDQLAQSLILPPEKKPKMEKSDKIPILTQPPPPTEEEKKQSRFWAGLRKIYIVEINYQTKKASITPVVIVPVALE
ncbi:MAG: hypothetical protein NW226_09305 [Microscillaceae bacterium]|nr:hypothetical protein [Microscillaceae bacterium]